jgi:hypothetical protein
MTRNHRTENSAEHHEVSALIPWYINHTLEEGRRQHVDDHFKRCLPCRDDLAVQLRIYEGIHAQPALDYVPVASLKRLQARLDALPTETTQQRVPARLEEQRHNGAPWRGWMAASLAAVAIAVGVLGADRWAEFEALLLPPNYRTVTLARPRPQGEVIRAVFAPTITLVELQTILDEAQLKIVSGPTEAGVYSLASNSTLAVRSSLARLRQHSTVRFAEATLPEPESGNSP